MTQQDFLSLWCDSQTLQQRAILHSPAFAMPVKLSGQQGLFSWAEATPDAADGQYPLAFVLQDGVEEILLAVSELKHFPELEKALLLKDSIPEELLLGIAAAEFTAYAPWLGDSITLKQLLREPSAENLKNTRAFIITAPEQEILQRGRISLTAGLEERWGKTEFLDVRKYFSEKSAPLPAYPCYAGFKLTQDELKNLKAGDRLLLPEWNTSEQSAGCLLIIDGRMGARGAQKGSSLSVQAPLQPFRSENDELLIRGEALSFTPLQGLQLLEDGNQLKLTLLTPGKFFLAQGDKILAEGISGEICGKSCLEITGVFLA